MLHECRHQTQFVGQMNVSGLIWAAETGGKHKVATGGILIKLWLMIYVCRNGHRQHLLWLRIVSFILKLNHLFSCLNLTRWWIMKTWICQLNDFLFNFNQSWRVSTPSSIYYLTLRLTQTIKSCLPAVQPCQVWTCGSDWLIDWQGGADGGQTGSIFASTVDKSKMNRPLPRRSHWLNHIISAMAVQMKSLLPPRAVTHHQHVFDSSY